MLIKKIRTVKQAQCVQGQGVVLVEGDEGERRRFK
jgi:hypothetical protein